MELFAIVFVSVAGGGVLVRARTVVRMYELAAWQRWLPLGLALIGIATSLLRAEDVVPVAGLIALPCYVASVLFAQAGIQHAVDEAARRRRSDVTIPAPDPDRTPASAWG
ncbi:hypothetical protein [Embleya hyalina]|uniref:Uncharacterized protein n=1 Tax=Embleya hyalina TaxID=516124 RepID=A0A401YHQ6_9ACTN|nr:hypothetical protein [Embleya hyalina]GCD94110.1 hypothetical protein EHYA_01767 [Embleya hyalina]